MVLFIRLCYSLAWCLLLQWLTQIELCALTSAIIWLFVPLIMFCIWILMLKLTPGFKTIQWKPMAPYLNTNHLRENRLPGYLIPESHSEIQSSPLPSVHTLTVWRADLILSSVPDQHRPWLFNACLHPSHDLHPTSPYLAHTVPFLLHYFSPHPSRLSSNVCLFITSELQ